MGVGEEWKEQRERSIGLKLFLIPCPPFSCPLLPNVHHSILNPNWTTISSITSFPWPRYQCWKNRGTSMPHCPYRSRCVRPHSGRHDRVSTDGVFHHMTRRAKIHFIPLALFLFDLGYRCLSSTVWSAGKVVVGQDMLRKFCNRLESKSQCVNVIIHPILCLQKKKRIF